MLLLPLLLALAPLLPTDAQESPEYRAPKIQSAIRIDGRLDETAWSTSPWTRDFIDIRGDDGPQPPLRTRVKLLWSDRYLFVGAEMEEPHLWGTLMDRDAIIYRDDDFEVFLDPSGAGENYFELEVNALGTVLDLFMNRPYNRRGSADLSFDMEGLQVAVSLHGTLNDPRDRDEGWVAEIAIPWSSLVPPEEATPPTSHSFGEAPAPGESWRVNFSRVDWPLTVVEGEYRKTAEPTRTQPHPESNWVWSPQGVVNMHVPERWGVVRFVDEPQNSRMR